MTRNDAEKVAHVLGELMRNVAQRLRYVGQWDAGGEYRRGNFVSHGGNVWHRNTDRAMGPPAVASPDWTLAVKRGKDGTP